MAKLMDRSWEPGTKLDYMADGNTFNATLDKQWDEIKAESEANGKGHLKFGVADGYAIYIVRSYKPLVLQHVNWLDGYVVDYALIRGLTVADVKRRLEAQDALNKLFGDL